MSTSRVGMQGRLWAGKFAAKAARHLARSMLFTAAVTIHVSASAAQPETIGRIERFDPAVNALVPADAKIEKLAAGFTWAEGPAWIRSGSYLLFTDVPENTLYRWSEQQGLSVFMKPSGYAGPKLEGLREAGANGLFAEPGGAVLLADSGSRVVSRLSLADKKKAVLASSYQGKRFNSPNDLVPRSDGSIFFTDPPYGLAGLNDSKLKELTFNGVFRIAPDGRVTLIDDQITFPNGIALSPDEKTLYVSSSDRKKFLWMAYTLDAAGNVVSRRVFADASDLVAEDKPGSADGMAIAADGHIFATAPGGVLIMTPDGRRLGRIETGTAIANCAFGDDGRTLYMTSKNMLARVRLSTLGLGF